MDEATVLEAVIDYLSRQDATFFIDPGGDQSYETVRERCTELSNCEINDSIKIGRKIPDIVGVNAQNEIFAVEAKGDDYLRKGIGQATDYRRGVHKSYLAAEATALSRFEDTAKAAGLGAIPVNPDSGEVAADQVSEPNPNIAGTEIAVVRRALALKTTEFESGRLDIPPMQRPENALLPILALKLENCPETLHQETCEQKIENSDANYSDASDRPIRLARTLQLIEKDAQGRLRLTDHGETAYTIIKGIHANEDKGDELQVGTIDDYRSYPEIVAFLRDRYLAAPPIRLLVKILADQDDSRMEVSKILSEISRESPDVFQSVFCSDDDEFRDLLMDENLSDRDFRKQILELTMVSYLYNFTRQLEVIDILETADKTSTSDDLVVGELDWEWDPEKIGRIGAL
ncbi:hypothetical protein [Natronobacterium texcoconense]|uniref:Uncharacterized protein n=1 Tax=Natronobacterium texcoconense TaxID=1095778 RepID=A0A1H1AIQ1_NATTX|nr:hypothetical protein [Natronobacterium texcoconense]SDQ39653.1 hypothetical protein SAMN04489842_0711 [Natronobacterium texcoconense]